MENGNGVCLKELHDVKEVKQILGYEEVSKICKKAFDEIIGTASYQHTEAVKWNQAAVEKITEDLVKMGYPYKICVCCIVMQTGLGAGLNVASACFWDKTDDLAYVVRWESKAVFAISSIFALKL